MGVGGIVLASAIVCLVFGLLVVIQERI